jgi:hypothetical protein
MISIAMDQVAQKAYTAYGSVTEFKNYQGLPMPKWEDLPPKIQAAWMAAVAKVTEIVAEELSSEHK